MTPNPKHSQIASEIAEAIHGLVQGLVRHPDNVAVTAVRRGSLIAIVVQAHPADFCRVVGQEGRHFNAMQLVAREAARKVGLDSWVTLDEQTQVTPSATGPTRPRQSQAADGAVALAPILARVLVTVIKDVDSLDIEVTNIGSASIIEVKASEADAADLRGESEERMFEPTVIDALKNLIDGIAKNHGRTAKLLVTPLRSSQP